MAAHGSPRILIVRLSAIGDVLHGLPVLVALREALPDAYLAWVVEGRSSELLRNHSSLDEVISVPRGWLKKPSAVWNLRRRLRAEGFDIAIDVQGLTKSAVAAWLSGAPRRIGFAGQDGREISRWLNNELVLPARTHVVDRNLELLRAIAIDPRKVLFDLQGDVSARDTARSMLVDASLDGRFVLINPGAGWPSKLWPSERYAAVAHELGKRRAIGSLVVWAGEQEHRWAQQIVAGSGGFARLAPATSLSELAALAELAALFLGSDTGPMHLAAAVGTPCVALFGPSSGERNGPYGPGHIVLQKMRLTGSSRERRTAGDEAMRAITVEDVLAACAHVLERSTALRQSA
ncbi:MAG TPA: glycosyltransferase family 9 protein [Pirellulales bacterium]|jgi:lipopolysaccharide heptosyltransferase I